jgi:hypothetical protein
MNFINLCPHTINIQGHTPIPPSGTVARCSEITFPGQYVDGIQVVTKSYGEVYDLPAPQSDTFYIVSMMIRLALPNRHDLLSPGDAIREPLTGQITGVTNLVINP